MRFEFLDSFRGHVPVWAQTAILTITVVGRRREACRLQIWGTMSATREPTILQALLPIGVLTALLGLAVYLFGADASYGPNQIGLLVATAVATSRPI